MLKRYLMIALTLFTLRSLSLTLLAQSSVPEILFESVPNFLKLPPDLYLGEAEGVAVNSKGHIFVFSRATRPVRPTALLPHNCSSSTATVSISARSAESYMPGPMRMPSGLTRKTTSGLSIKART